MYQVLYRKYRPSTFEDVVGQSHVTDTLQNELRLGRVHHAYLFTGSRGTGKTTCAKIFAKAVNCLDLRNGDPCGTCEICKGIDSGEILDVVEMDAASNRGIDDIRSIIDEVAFAPAKAKYRVYIVDEVHMLSRDAWNALLKTLEEPPAHVIFILATTEVNKIPETILSRCQRFDFHRISPSDIAGRLKHIAQLESISLSDEAALLISVIADGALRDAVSLLDRCIGISDDVTADVVRAAAGLAAQGHIFALASATVKKNVQEALELIDKLYRDAKDMGLLCEELQSHFRSLMLIKTVRNPRELVVMSDREYDAAVAQSDYLSLPDILYYMNVLSRARSRMKDSPSPRAELEMALVKLCSPELDTTDGALFARVAALEKAVRLLSSQLSALQASPLSAGTPANAESRSEKGTVSASYTATVVQPQKKDEPKPEFDEAQTADDKSAIDISPKDGEGDREEVPSNAPEIDAVSSAARDEATDPVIEATATPEKNERAEAVNSSEPVKSRESADKTAHAQQAQSAQAAQPASRPGVDMEELIRNAVPFTLWPEVVANLSRYSKAIGYAFEGANAYVSGDYLLIETDYEIAFELLKKSDQRDQIRKAVQEVTGRVYKLGPYRLPDKTVTRDDVFNSFVNKLRDSGINVTEEQ